MGINNFIVDVAASKENAVCSFYYHEAFSGLTQPWSLPYVTGWAWCNPPYGNIEPWVEKAWAEAERGVSTIVLVPASVGANWWKEWVEDCAYQVFLNGRITFVGCDDPYPKDCALLLYTPWGFKGNEVWSWQS